LADQSTRLIVDALSRAAAEPAGLPLFAARANGGLFPATAKARQAAQQCRDSGLLKITAAPRETAAITDKGLAWLLAQSNPRQVLEDFVRLLEEKQAQAADLIAAARQMAASLDGLKSAVDRLSSHTQLHHLNGQADKPTRGQGSETAPPVSLSPRPLVPSTDILSHLEQWHKQSSGDCPLPELHRRLARLHPDLTIGRFHDALRLLHDQRRLYLHPWTGPLYELPEPPFALLIGHEIAYYASART
jgi:hypothetical protein